MNMTGTPAINASTSLATPSTEVDMSVDKIPGPTRMVLVDTKLFPGAIAEVPLDGNCLITGTNAAGKTSIIQLPTLFYGVSPSKISDKQQGKSFYGHYLPNTTSYVAFEYRHRDGHPRTVIIHSAPGDDKPMFRFVRSAMYEDMFITDDDRFVESQHLASHLRNRNYDVAEKIIDTQSDYRTIIHGLPVKGKNSKDQSFLKQMVARFTVSQYQHPLNSVDDVVFSMLKRDASLQKLEDMIAQKILGDDQELDLDGDKANLENWPAQFKAYLEVMDSEGDARKLDVKCIELKGYEIERRTAISELLALRIELADQHTAATTAKTDLEQKLQAAADTFAIEKSTISEEEDKAQRAVVAITNDIDDIEVHDKQSRSMGILTKLALSQRKQTIKDERDAASKRHTALIGDQSKLSVKYDDLKQAARDSSAAEIASVNQEKEIERDNHEAAISSAQERHTKAEAEVAEAHSTNIADAEEDLEDANGELGAAKEAKKNPSVPQDIIAKRDAAQQASTVAGEAHSKSLQDARGLRKTLDDAQKAHAKVESTIDAHKRKIEALKETKANLEQSKKPPADSLLAHLREQHEGWGDSIGKVINPDLLLRTDLSPRQIENTAGVFGLQIDLDDIPVPDIVDLSQIDDEIAECDVDIAEEKAQLSEVENRMVETLRAQTNASAALTRHQGAEPGLLRAYESAKAALKLCEAALTTARENAVQLSEERAVVAQATLLTARQAKTAAVKERDEDVAATKAVHAVEITALKEAHKSALKQLDDRIAAIKVNLKTRLTDFDEELKSALKKKGVDPKLIAQLQKEVEDRDADLTSIRTNAATVDAWNSFVKNRLPLLPGLKTKKTAAESIHEAKKKKLTDLRKKWQAQKDGFNTKITTEQSIIDARDLDLKKISKRLFDIDVTGIAPAASTSSALDDLILRLNSSEKEARDLHKAIRTGATEIAKVFDAVKGSPAYQHLHEHKAQFTSTVEGPEWVPAFIEWFDVRHQTHRDTMLQNGRAIANKIKGRFQRLTSLDRRISAQNRLLQQNLDQNNVISVVQELNVGITSSIRKLEFMPDMQKLSDLHETWMKSGSVLPPEGFSDAMDDLLQHWNGKNGLTTDLREHIRIEGYIIENLNKRNFHARTDMKNLSSNGISYLVLTTILVAFVNMVRGKAPMHMVWALDELGDLDAANTRKLLNMLRENNITLVSATPQATAEVNKLFDYRVKVIAGPKLADIRNAGRSSQRLLSSPADAAEEDQRASANHNETTIAGAA